MDVGLTSEYINTFLEKLNIEYFSGVYACNNIPKYLITEKNFSIICNLDKDTEPGSHFITIICSPNAIIYIDSLGKLCSNKYIKQFLEGVSKKQNIRIINVVEKVQDTSSVFCGFFAILYVLYFNLSSPLKLTLLAWHPPLQ
jgi:hypothetical protein